MSRGIVLRVVAAVVTLLVCVWVMMHTRWVEEEVDNDPRGAAATDEYYSLRQVLQAAGSTLEKRTSLEPMPPAGATLMLDSSLWSIFPERDARLKAWVENGGHLVVLGRYVHGKDVLRWVPLAFPASPTTPAASAASDDADKDADTDDSDDQDDNAPPRKKSEKQKQAESRAKLRQLFNPRKPWEHCVDLREPDDVAQPAYGAGATYRACAAIGRLHALDHAQPVWQLDGSEGTLAMRVTRGRGDVTGVSPSLLLDNHGLLYGDNALIAAAVLQAAPGRAVWIIGDEAREPLLKWLWHEARTPTLLVLAGVALALWRLMVRFGPREAVPPQARRSMGEQVRGTGRFVASTDPRALHAATRRAFEDVASRRVENWIGLDDLQRIEALARAVAHSHALDQPALLQSLNIGGGATPAQILSATSVLEQARRALLRTPPAPPSAP